MSTKIERHKDYKKIVKLLASGEENSKILEKFPGITWQDLEYFKDCKLKEIISNSPELKAEIEGDRGNDTLSEIRCLKRDAVKILKEAQEAGDLGTALKGIREARGCLETILEAEGRIRAAAQVNVNTQINLATSPEWLELQALIVTTLKPYPEAFEALRHALPSS